ncbi:MAG TPA: hypothetical protein VHP36_08470 [Chitinispirillaceae bacterium]|nr:hypothetical protein [Chitinispirillaceae bacterium]
MKKIICSSRKNGPEIAKKFYRFASKADYEALFRAFSDDNCIDNVIKLLGANYNPAKVPTVFEVNDITFQGLFRICQTMYKIPI